MTLEEAHRICAAIAGQLSLALVRGKPPPALLARAVKALRRVADALEQKIEGGA